LNFDVASYALIPRCRPNSAICIDYRCADKKRCRIKRRRWRHSIGLHSLFQISPMFIHKKWTVEPGYAFENTAFEQWFENVKGCREAALHLFLEQIPPTDSWHQVDSDWGNFYPLMPIFTLVSLLERYLCWFETATQRVDIGKQPSAHL
jgi:hypothetical protein